MVADRWLSEIYEPIIAMVPPGARGKLEPAEIVPRDPGARLVPLRSGPASRSSIFETARDYIDNALAAKPEEAVAVPEGGSSTEP